MKWKNWIAFSLLMLAAVFGPASAQDYPNRPITFVVAYPPGGGADAIGRLLAQKLGEALGQTIVVDNRAGFSGNIGAQFVAKSKPDGYTLLVAPWTTYAINSVMYPDKVGYSLSKGFQPITTIGFLPLVLIVNSSLNINSVPELIAAAKAKPGALSYASTGNGSLEQVAAELFKRQAQVEMLHVPYKGSGPAMTDLIGGQVQVFFITAPTAVANAGNDRLKLLMLTTDQKSPALPQLPTPREAGVPGFEVFSTYGLLAPTGTPPALVKRLNDEVGKILHTPEVKARFLALGVEASPSTPEEATRRITSDLDKWGKVAKEANLKAD